MGIPSTSNDDTLKESLVLVVAKKLIKLSVVTLIEVFIEVRVWKDHVAIVP